MSDESKLSPAPAVHATQRDEFDYIVIGAGSAGCALVNRLSEDEDVSILVLEAGGPEAEPKMDEAELLGSRYDWKYHTEPERQLHHRRIAWPRGKVYGGSSSISSMVYLRGNRLDYDHWNYLGNSGWGYEDVLPYFKKSETNGHFRNEFHGDEGPLSVESVSDNSALKQGFLEAACSYDLGGDPNWDFNGERQEGGAGYYQKTLKNGENQSVAAAFLVPVFHRPNLAVRPFSLVRRLLWDGTQVIGVEYVSNDWDLHTVRSRREVILCAGAVDSPQLLMLSGVGPAQYLHRLEIAVKVDLPGVGENLQDHLNITFMYQPNDRAGQLNNRVGTGGLFLRTGSGLQKASPDLQFFAIEVVVPEGVPGFPAGPLYFCTACAVRPHSLGRISLASADPLAAPLIQANYLTAKQDMKVLTEGIDWIRRLTQSSHLRRLLKAEVVPGADCRTPEDIQAFVRQSANTNFHPVGTCKMGHDALAVVDDQLRVHGVAGLRVADASIMPTIVNTNTNAACVMIGERAADLIHGK